MPYETTVDSRSHDAAAAGAHPYLFFDAADVNRLRNQSRTTHREIYAPVLQYATSLLGTTPVAQPPANADLDFYRNSGNQLIPLSFTCVITNAANYCNLAKKYLLAYVQWNRWDVDNERDLGYAHLLYGSSIAFDWLYNKLTAAERQTVIIRLTSRANGFYLASTSPIRDDWNNWWHSSYMQNHYTVNNSALGLAGLALSNEPSVAARARQWTNQAIRQLTRTRDILNGIGDGSWHEGIPYQDYALRMMLPFMSSLREDRGTNLFPSTYLTNYAYWRLYNYTLGDTEFIMSYGNFEWSWGNTGLTTLLRFIANEYNNPYVEWLARQYRSANRRSSSVWETPWYVFEFLYYDPTVIQKAPHALPKARTFPDLEGVIWRTGWRTGDLVFGLKTGPYGGRFAFNTFTQGIYPWNQDCRQTECQLNIGHDHADANTFYLYKNGHWLAPETVGVGDGETTYHNTLLIDGQNQYRPSGSWRNPADFAGSDGYLEHVVGTTNFNYLAADATQPYKKTIAGLQDITRHVIFVRPNYFIMVDSLTSTRARQYDWISHFGESVSVSGRWVRGDAEGQDILGVGVIAPSAFKTTIGNDGQPYVRISPSTRVANTRLINLLFPATTSTWATRPGFALLDDTGEAVAIHIDMNDSSNRQDDILLTYTKPVATVVGSYYYDGQVAVISRNADTSLQRIFMYGGSRLNYPATQGADTILVSNLDPGQAFEAQFTSQRVRVSGNILTHVRLYAPGVTSLIVNGTSQSFTRDGDYILFGPVD